MSEKNQTGSGDISLANFTYSVLFDVSSGAENVTYSGQEGV